MKRFFSVPAWIEELRANLPQDDDATLIVAAAQGSRFLRLDAAEIERHIAESRRQRMIALSLIGGLFAVVALVGAMYYQSTVGLRAAVADAVAEAEGHAAEVERLTKALDVIVEAVPLTATMAESSDDASNEEKVEKVVEYLQYKDRVFRSYVAATGLVMKGKVDSLVSDLTAAGFDRRQVRSLMNTAPPAGGLPTDPTTSDLFSHYVDDTTLSRYEELQRLGNFVAVLPSVQPMRDARTTSGFGVRRHPITRRADMHAGVDYVSLDDTRIFSSGAGVVSFAGYNGGYGNMVTIDHGHGIETLYAHMSRIDVKVGQRIRANTMLGRMGNTGFSTGPHLHFEVRFNGRHINPAKMFEIAAEVQTQ